MWHYRHTNEMYHNALESRPYYAVSYNDDDIYHYGVMGMKWGIRKQRETTGTGRGRGRKKLTARQKKIIRNVAIGAGITGAAIGGGILLSKTGAGKRALAGLRRYKQAAKATKGMSEGQLRLMRSNVTNPTDLKRIDKAIGKAAKSGLKTTTRSMNTGQLRSTITNQNTSNNLRKAAKKELYLRGGSGKWNQINSKLAWNKQYSTARDSVKNTAAARAYNANKAAYNRSVTVGNNIRTGVIGTGLVGGATAAGAYAYNKKRKKS